MNLTDWRADAACRNYDTSVFFPEEGEDGLKAKSICAICPVQGECLEWAISTREPDGIWGGLGPNERRRIRRRRQEEARRAVA